MLAIASRQNQHSAHDRAVWSSERGTRCSLQAIAQAPLDIAASAALDRGTRAWIASGILARWTAEPTPSRVRRPRARLTVARSPGWLATSCGSAGRGFGGPIALVGYMQRDLVEDRGWFSEDEFQQGLAVGQMMPGPLAAQTAMWLGYLQAGARGARSRRGAVRAAAVPDRHRRRGALRGVPGPRAGARGLPRRRAGGARDHRHRRLQARALDEQARSGARGSIAVVLCAATAISGAEIVWLFLARRRVRRHLLRRRAPAPAAARLRASPRSGCWPPSRASRWTGSGASLGALGWFFFKAGPFTFGSGLAIVPFLHAGLVDEHHWLTEQQFVDAVAMGLISPGPVVIMATFAGYLVFGLAGAVVATVCRLPARAAARRRPRPADPPPRAPPAPAGLHQGRHRRRGRRHRRRRDRHRGRTSSTTAGRSSSPSPRSQHCSRRGTRVAEPALVAAAALIGLVAF